MTNKTYFTTVFFLLLVTNMIAQQFVPTIELKKVEISGTIVNKSENATFPVSVKFVFPAPFSGQFRELETMTDSLGNFKLNVELDVFPSMCMIATDFNPVKNIYYRIIQQTPKINIVYNSDNEIENVISDFSSVDALSSTKIFCQMLDYKSKKHTRHLYNLKPEKYAQLIDSVINQRFEQFLYQSDLSAQMKSYIGKEFILACCDYLFDYKAEMERNYQNVNQKKPDKKVQFHIPSKKYYSFLRKLDLNNPEYLTCVTYREFLQKILSDEILAIPPIENTPVEEWINNLRKEMDELTGLNGGLFYDILAASAYAKQFINHSKPLTEIQKENIHSYFKNKSIIDILLKQSEYVRKLEVAPVVINAIPIVKDAKNNPQGKIIDAIIAKYKNKVVLVDFWATWCGPCKEAMSQMKPLEHEFADKDVVFVFITDTSSPKRLWEDQIKGIGNEHYYLNSEQWTSISFSKKYGFEYIPTYLVFDKSGKLANKITSFPGYAEMKNIITKLLQ